MKDQLNWNDLVFDNRNKEYGAYRLRQEYGRRVMIAFVGALITLALVMAFPFIRKFFDKEEIIEGPKKAIVYSELQPPPPIDADKPPPERIELPPKVKEAIKFVPPVVTPKEVVDETPTSEDLKLAEPALETNEGEGQIVFDDVVEQVVAEPADDPTKVYMIVQQQPEFPGGTEAMMKFLSKNMRYPSQARRIGTSGLVYVEFVVDHTGNITMAKVIKGIGAGCDEEALRVVRKMPRWKPGKQNGKAVNVRFVLPLKFILG